MTLFFLTLNFLILHHFQTVVQNVAWVTPPPSSESVKALDVEAERSRRNRRPLIIIFVFPSSDGPSDCPPVEESPHPDKTPHWLDC